MAMERFSSGLPSLFERFFDSDWMDSKDPDYAHASADLPMVNIMENADEYLIEVAAPGMRKTDFRVCYNEGKLTISSDRQEVVQDGVSYLRREYRYRSFHRSFDIPEDFIEGDQIHANYNDGILQITLPKREEIKPKPPREISI